VLLAGCIVSATEPSATEEDKTWADKVQPLSNDEKGPMETATDTSSAQMAAAAGPVDTGNDAAAPAGDGPVDTGIAKVDAIDERPMEERNDGDKVEPQDTASDSSDDEEEESQRAAQDVAPVSQNPSYTTNPNPEDSTPSDKSEEAGDQHQGFAFSSSAQATLNAEPAETPTASQSEPKGQIDLETPSDVSTTAADAMNTSPYSKKLGGILADRKAARVQSDLAEAQAHAAHAVAESEMESEKLHKLKAEMDDLEAQLGPMEEARKAAASEAQAAEDKMTALHHKEMDEQSVVQAASRAAEEARGMRAGAAIQEIITATEDGSGSYSDGDEQDDEDEADAVRAFNVEQTSNAANETALASRAFDVKEAEYESAKSKYHDLDRERAAANTEIYESEHKAAAATWDLQNLHNEINNAKEHYAYQEAMTENAAHTATSAQKALNAAEAVAAGEKDGMAQTYAAQALDNSLAESAIIKAAQDQDGLDDHGNSLIAPKGEVSREYERVWHATPDVPVGSNPLLDAASAAAVDDTDDYNVDEDE
jgi:hypothetical protein